jgi:hypothetical protein
MGYPANPNRSMRPQPIDGAISHCRFQEHRREQTRCSGSYWQWGEDMRIPPNDSQLLQELPFQLRCVSALCVSAAKT